MRHTKKNLAKHAFELSSVPHCFWVAQREFVYNVGSFSSTYELPIFPLKSQTPAPKFLFSVEWHIHSTA